jgi:hypothetical protein
MQRYFRDLEARIDEKKTLRDEDFGGDGGEFYEDHSLWDTAEKEIIKEIESGDKSPSMKFSTAWGKPIH